MEPLIIAAFGGFRSIPPKEGGAGSDKFAFDLYPRIVKRGHELTAYCRIYPGDEDVLKNMEYEGVKIVYFKTVNKAGFDTLIHSFKATFDIIFRSRAKIVHIHSGANSIWALFLRLFGKKVYVSQFAMDWKRDKWPWYGKLFYQLSNYLTAYIPNRVIFDNIYTKEYFENYAFYCDPASPGSIYEAILRASGEKYNEVLKNKILTKYTWELAAAKTLAAYQEITGKR